MSAATQQGAFITGNAPNGRFCGRHPEEPPTPCPASGSGPPGSLQGVSRAGGPEALEELGRRTHRHPVRVVVPHHQWG